MLERRDTMEGFRLFQSLADTARSELNHRRSELKQAERKAWEEGKRAAELAALKRESERQARILAIKNRRVEKRIRQEQRQGWKVTPAKHGPVIKGATFTRKELADLEAEMLKPRAE